MFNLYKTPPSCTAQEASVSAGRGNTQFIDVRTEGEYMSGHARGAKNIPLDLFPEATEDLKGFDAIYVICRSGGRSAQAVGYLTQVGIHAINVSGGTMMWQASGLPME